MDTEDNKPVMLRASYDSMAVERITNGFVVTLTARFETKREKEAATKQRLLSPALVYCADAERVAVVATKYLRGQDD